MLRHAEGVGQTLCGPGVVEAPTHPERATRQRADAIALGRFRGHEVGYRLPAAGDHNLTAVFDGFDQFGQLCFGFLDGGLHEIKLVLITNSFKVKAGRLAWLGTVAPPSPAANEITTGGGEPHRADRLPPLQFMQKR